MSRPKVLVSNPSVPDIGPSLLKEYCDVIQIQNQTKEEIISKVKGVDGIFWASKLRVDKDILDAAGPQMKTIGTMSAGYNHIDLDELKKRGIKLANTPLVLNDAVADVAVLLALAASRRLHEGRQKIDRNEWKSDFQWMLGQDIVGSTVGIIGLGGIGQAILKRLKPFLVQQFLYTGIEKKKKEPATNTETTHFADARMLTMLASSGKTVDYVSGRLLGKQEDEHRRFPQIPSKELGAKFVSLDTLARESDFVIVACPLNSETQGMCNADFFSKMKKTAVFVNISRGEVVDQPALVKALKEGQIFAAGLDVVTPEPLPPGDELLKLPNVVILPHLGSATKNTRDAMAQLTAQNILRGVGGAEMFTPVEL